MVSSISVMGHKEHHIKISVLARYETYLKINKINLQLFVPCKHFKIHQSESPPFATNHLLKVQGPESH